MHISASMVSLFKAWQHAFETMLAQLGFKVQSAAIVSKMEELELKTVAHLLESPKQF